MFPSGFEWDPQKNMSNTKKHGFSFESAENLFQQVVYESPAFIHNGEWRKFAVGLLDQKEVTVIFCERDGKKRIISIRRARDYERDTYRRFIATFYRR